MKRILFLLLVLAAAMPAAFELQAQTPGTDGRQHLQRERIREGRRNGDLTRREARKLRREQRHIQRMERRAQRDGQVGPREKRKLDRAQDRASRNIFRKKHNRRSR